MTDQSTSSPKKKLVSFTIKPEIFIKLKIYSSKYNVPFGCVIEGLVDTFTEDSNLFPKIDFYKYKSY